MRTRFWLPCVVVLVFAVTGSARGHFLFIRVGPIAEGGRSAEVYFSEQAEAGDPQFVEKIAHTQLWLQRTAGEFQPLNVHKQHDRLRAAVPASGTLEVIGFCEYGVLARPGKTPFLLRYYPKAIAGIPAELNALRPRAESALEVVATVQPDRLRFRLLHHGKPVPGAEFHTVDADLNNQTFAADKDGNASWTPPSPGRYSVYCQQNTKASGEAGGKHYDEIREFATIAFTWPFEATRADAEALSLWKEALAARAQWKDFPGFEAEIEGQIDGRPFEGKVSVSADGDVELTGVEAQAKSWVESQVGSIVMHRMPADPDAEPVVRFGDEDDVHPLGRLVLFEGGQFASSYRIKDRQILVVNRHVGRSNMTILTLDNDRNAEGQFLPRSYVVDYWDAADERLRRVETVQDRWVRLAGFDLPEAHTVSTASDGGLSVKSLTLSKHKLLRPAAN